MGVLIPVAKNLERINHEDNQLRTVLPEPQTDNQPARIADAPDRNARRDHIL